MEKRRLGKADLEFTTVGFGTWALGGANWNASWGAQDDNDSIAAIRRAVELGINWIDTAQIYGLGHSEEIVGRALEGVREKIYIATKCGRTQRPDGVLCGDLSAAKIRSDCEGSLKRLRVECIDLYQIHWPQPDEQIEDAWQTIQTLKAEGKILYAGVSNFSMAQMKRLLPIAPIASQQPPYSLLRREIETDMLKFCQENGIGVLAYGTMHHGLLSGTFNRARFDSLPADDFRKRHPAFKEPMLTANLVFADGLKKLAASLNVSAPHLAIAWVLRQPALTSAILGARRPGQIEETYGAAELQLSEGTLSEIERLLAERDEMLSGG